MNNLFLILTALRAAIAARAARDRALTALLVVVWGRVSRIAARLERLVRLWRAGTLPKARASRAGRVHATGIRVRLPTAPGWLAAEVWETRALGSQLAHLLTEAEMVGFLAAVPQAGRILRPLSRMLAVGVRAVRVRAVRVAWAPPVPVEARAGGLVAGPEGRFLWV